MNKKRTLFFGAMVLASAAIAVVVAFGFTIVPSAVSHTSADPEMVPCAGETWPRFSEDCISASRHADDRQSGVRVIEVPGAEG